VKKFGNQTDAPKKAPAPPAAAEASAPPAEKLDTIDVGKDESGYGDAPTATLCWQRPSMTADDPMAPPCDRKAGHHGPHTWDFDGSVKRLAAELENEAGSEAAGQVRRSERDVLLDIAGKLHGLVGPAGPTHSSEPA